MARATNPCMSRYISSLLVCLVLGASAQATAQPARGLIVKLKSAETAGVASAREQPQLLRERLSAVAHDAGMTARGPLSLLGRGHHLMRFAKPLQGQALDAAVRRMRLHPDVAWVEPDVLMKPAQALLPPNDTAYLAGLQDHLKEPATYGAGVNMPAGWARTTGGLVVVAVLDTGIRFDHPDLAGRLLPGYDFVSEVEYANDGDGRDEDPSDPGDWVSASDRTSKPALFGSCAVLNSSWHGTFIAGQLSAVTNNAIGVAGINWVNQVLPLRVSGKCGAFLSDILDAMRWAAGLSVEGAPANPNPAKVINLSFGGDVACTASYQDVIDEVTAAGALVVVAAGNDGGQPRRPADCNNVLAVGAAQANGQKAGYSNAGPTIAVIAPGGTGAAGAITNIYSTVNTGTTTAQANDYGYKRGTSFSAPLAAGVASLMVSLNPALTPSQLIARIRSSARAHVSIPGSPSCGPGTLSVACNCTTDTCGGGLLDAGNATLVALNPVPVIAGVGAPGLGATIPLDGRASSAIAGASIVSYQWSQVAGPTLAIPNAASALTSVVLPATAGTFQFRLSVADSASRTGDEYLTVTTTAPPPAESSGGGGGSFGWLWGAGLWLLAALAWRRRLVGDAASAASPGGR